MLSGLARGVSFFSELNASHLVDRHQVACREMLNRYPHVMREQFTGRVAYTLQHVAPDAMVAQGGFAARDSGLWLSNTGSGDNWGSVCLTFLPEVAAIFARSQHAYLYALPLQGEFFLPGGRWRQVISPGALLVSSWWLARQVISVQPDGKLILGSTQGAGEPQLSVLESRFEDYLAGELVIPKAYDAGEDYPMEYDIKDTDFTREFQERVKAHYASLLPALLNR